MPTSFSPEERGPALPVSLCRVVAGLQCGVMGGALILVWFVIQSLLSREFWWTRFNVAGGLFYGNTVYHSGLSRATLSGAALLLLYYCLAGMLFGALAASVPRIPILLRAALYVSLLHAFASYCLWPAMGVFAASWFAWKTVLPADLLLLLALARFPAYDRRLAVAPDAGIHPVAPAGEPFEPLPGKPANPLPSPPPPQDGFNS